MCMYSRNKTKIAAKAVAILVVVECILSIIYMTMQLLR